MKARRLSPAGTRENEQYGDEQDRAERQHTVAEVQPHPGVAEVG